MRLIGANSSLEVGGESVSFQYYARRSSKFWKLVTLIFLTIFFSSWCSAQDPCPRFPSGSAVKEPPALFSRNGKLIATFTYQTEVDQSGMTRFCFKTLDGRESPTLYLNPGDELILRVKNLVPPDAPGLPAMKMPADGMEMTPAAAAAKVCGAAVMTQSSVNVHYHGTKCISHMPFR
jgi:hypothetical protein